ncbi:hypothetical protein HJC23_003538 [Cyclotella cryptica]|uniref:Uncharacterized protein n=1 Tax=Cyclotella cryptica TaxID=29204 RepID=A0ABD3P1G4_9STRA|eukprot:CCRYP_018599-RA/>CCRYP_018599-RA protein AED:0.31 eAED:0.31 QI:0/-1/0/1/-1/1/1/0/214
MLSRVKPMFTSSFYTKHVVAACTIQHRNVELIWRPSPRHHFVHLRTPCPFNQLKYNSDSSNLGGFKDVDLKEHRSQMVPPNITKDVFSMKANEDQVVYDEDYDRFYSHMPPSSMKNQDSEQLDGLEMIHHDDIEPSGSISFNYSSTVKELEEATRVESMSDIYREHGVNYADDEYIELEEDWEIMHLSVDQGKGRSGGCYEVNDNIDDVNDVVQ